ncbi:zinc finger MYM-type protein 1-like [Panicum hallii]|uniref:zinc finger MYM-type protein 1-like n=1 Tax=Panicum hallii TaxID=206008 RepID=UPI000DF4CCBB|nr:zinc finger MYM-type protein 1-like [Panicum hallii]
MAIIVRYVNKKGQVVERFLGIKHVKLTTSEALKRAIVEVLSAHGLTIAKIRGQGYDGASNMRVGSCFGFKVLFIYRGFL